MSITLLNEADMDLLLHSLTRDDILGLQTALAEALHTYSTTPASPSCGVHQPPRTSMSRAKGTTTTLFMPASDGDIAGIKIVSLAETETATETPASDTSSIASTLASTTLSQSTATTSPRSPSTSSSSPARSPSTHPSISSSSTSTSTNPTGFLTLISPTTSLPTALLNATNLTAFRTALLTSLLLKKRHACSHVAVFGAGAQAYWHIRLALLLRSGDIKHVYIINRSFSRAASLLERFYGAEAAAWRGDVKFSVLTREYGEYARVLKDEVRKADVIVCTTPSLEPLFPGEWLTGTEGRRKGRLVVGIGSYKKHMCELAPEIFVQAVKPHSAEGGRHWHKHAKGQGVVVVDSLDGCLEEAGEIWRAGIGAQEMVEVGELVMLRKWAEGEGSEQNKGLREWLERGTVVFKSVGMGLMDVVVGREIVGIAEERSIGRSVPGL